MATKRKRGSETKFYSVRVGKAPGIYHSWDDCLDQVRGFKGAVYKSFTSLIEAESFLKSSALPRSTSAKPPKFYAVRNGHVPGVYTDWPSAQKQITGFQKPKHKSFATKYEAESYVRGTSPDPTAGEPAAKKQKSSDTPIPVSLPPGLGPLPPDAEDGFDDTIMLDPLTGQLRHKTERELNATKAVPLEGPATSSSEITVWTDGACRANGQKGAIAGVGVYFGPADARNISERLPGDRQTNQRAELTAVKRALDMVPMNANVLVVSDSNYAIKCVTEWFQSWEKKKWKTAGGKPVENKDLVEEILGRIRVREACKAKTRFEWVKGHAGDEHSGNYHADKLAVMGALNRAPRQPAEDMNGEVEEPEFEYE